MARSPSSADTPTIFFDRPPAAGAADRADLAAISGAADLAAEIPPPARVAPRRFLDSLRAHQGFVIGALAVAALALQATLALALLAVFAGIRITRLRKALGEAREIGRYELVRRLGRGGMGEVWLARHRLLARPAAIKFVRPEALGHRGVESLRGALPRFEREARITAQLTSPHTIEIYDFGMTEDGALCYVMEYLDGLDLDSLVRKHGPLSPARTVHLLRQVCVSLAEAHQAGLVHRDVKPANIYVCRKGLQYDFVKVLDFGLVAKVAETPEHGVVLGTPATMAPEVARGKPADARADLYSLGCVAYWLLTGRPVFGGKTPQETIVHHVRTKPDPPSLHALGPIPRELELLVLEALAKDPERRVPSAAEMSRRLAACETGPGWSPGQAMKWWTTAEKAESAALSR